MPKQSQRNLSFVLKIPSTVRWLIAVFILLIANGAGAEPLRIAYTSIGLVYVPLWITKDAGIFKKYNVDPELLYIAGGPPSLQALIAGDVAISFTAEENHIRTGKIGCHGRAAGAGLKNRHILIGLQTPFFKQVAGDEVGCRADAADSQLCSFELLGLFDAGNGPQLERKTIYTGAEENHIRTRKIGGHSRAAGGKRNRNIASNQGL